MGYLGSSEQKSYRFKILIDFHSDFKQAIGMCIRLRNNHQKSVTKSTECQIPVMIVPPEKQRMAKDNKLKTRGFRAAPEKSGAGSRWIHHKCKQLFHSPNYA